MPKVKIDYSNTIFYKIYCKDTSINDLYIGHTTNFVQRKHCHKQSCINPKSSNYKCKLYNVIRDNMGWDNWKMEIIAFHNCEDLYYAKKQEQYYFEKYKATLNSIEPLPPRKPKPIVDKIPKEPLYCNISSTKFRCEYCDYTTSRQSQYDRHIMTRKHKIRTNIIGPSSSKTYQCSCNKTFKHASSLWNHKQNCKDIVTDSIERSNSKRSLFMCNCGKTYKYDSGFYRHKKNCNFINQEIVEDTPMQAQSQYSNLIMELVKQNNEFKQLMMEQNKQIQEQNKQIIDIAKNSSNTTNNI